MFPVPCHTPDSYGNRLPRQASVPQYAEQTLPAGCIIKTYGFRAFYVSTMKAPSGIEIIYYSSATG